LLPKTSTTRISALETAQVCAEKALITLENTHDYPNRNEIMRLTKAEMEARKNQIDALKRGMAHVDSFIRTFDSN